MEVLLVLILLTAVLVPLLQLLATALLASSEVKGSNTATVLAVKKLEQIRNTTFGSISSEANTTIASYPAYSQQVLVGAPSTNLKDIHVIVYWSPGKGTISSVSVETLISNY